MMRALKFLILLSLLSIVAFSQSPAFDIADVHVSAKGAYTWRAPAMSGGALRNDDPFDYSALSVVTGSTADARRAGI